MNPHTSPKLPNPLVRGDFLFHAQKELSAQKRCPIALQSVKNLNQRKLSEIDPRLDAEVLKGNDRIKPLPLFGANGVVHTVVDDFDEEEKDTLKDDAKYLRYQDWCITRNAMESAIWWAHAIDKDTQRLLEDFRAFLSEDAKQPKPRATDLSERVCKWGGSRVVVSGHTQPDGKDLESLLRAWFLKARTGTRKEALADGQKFKGLGVSFASKHLRFINPDRYATLDNILSQAFGFEMTDGGYEAFLQSLEAFKETHKLPYNIADIEHGLFFLVQPFFSSSPPQEHKPYSDKSPMFGTISLEALAREFDLVTAFSPTIDIYRRKNCAEHWYGIDRQEVNGRRRIKILMLVAPKAASNGTEVIYFFVDKELNMQQTRACLHALYQQHSASKAILDWQDPDFPNP